MILAVAKTQGSRFIKILAVAVLGAIIVAVTPPYIMRVAGAAFAGEAGHLNVHYHTPDVNTHLATPCIWDTHILAGALVGQMA
jgi:hypothetical protein